jgi:hypothetical protein
MDGAPVRPHARAIGGAPAFRPSPDGCSVALEVGDSDAAIGHLKKKNVKWQALAAPAISMPCAN